MYLSTVNHLLKDGSTPQSSFDDQSVANPSELVELVDTGWSKVRQSVPDIAIMSRVTNAFQERTAEGQHFRLIASIGAVVVFGCLAVLPIEFLIKEDTAAMAVGVVANYSFVNVKAQCSSQIPKYHCGGMS